MLRLAILATFALFVSTTLGFFGRIFWIFDLFSHFRVQYLIGAAICALILASFRSRGWLILATILLITNAILVAPYTTLGRVASASSASANPLTQPSIQVLAFNIHAENNQPDDVLQFLRNSDADVVTLFEITPQFADRLSEIRDVYPYQHHEAKEGFFGLVMLSKYRFMRSDVLQLGSPKIASVFANIHINGSAINIFGVHPYPPFNGRTTSHRNNYLLEIADLVSKFQGPTIVMGDFNTTPWSYPMRQFEATSGFHSSALGKNMPPTWLGTIYPFGIPIDHVMLSPNLRAITHTTGPKTGSDHSPIIVDIALLD